MTDIPPPPPGFSLDPAPRRPILSVRPKKPEASHVPPPPEGFVLDHPKAIDGDTLRDGARLVRLWGTDAPERKQLGWDRQGNPQEIGEQSRDVSIGAGF